MYLLCGLLGLGGAVIVKHHILLNTKLGCLQFARYFTSQSNQIQFCRYLKMTMDFIQEHTDFFLCLLFFLQFMIRVYQYKFTGDTCILFSKILPIESDLNFIFAILYCILESGFFVLAFVGIFGTQNIIFHVPLVPDYFKTHYFYFCFLFGTVNAEVKTEVCMLEDLHCF